MNNLKVGSIEFDFPERWDELLREQLIQICQLMLKNLPRVRFKFFALLILMQATIVKKRELMIDKVAHYYIKRKKDRFLLSAIMFHDLMATTDFLLKPSQLVKNLLPELKVRFGIYYGPTDGFFNVLFEEFMLMDKAYDAFIRTKKDEHLDRLVAILYRPEVNGYNPNDVNYNGDRREPFNDFLIDARQKKVEKIKPHFKLGVFLYVQGCKYFMAEKFPLVFKQKSSGRDDGLGYLSLVDNMNSGDATKNEQIRKLNVYDAMTRLQQAAKASEEMKARAKRK